MRSVGVVFLLPARRVDAQQGVERADSDCGGQDRDEAEESPPAETVHAEEQKNAAADEPNACIVGSDIRFHGVWDVAEFYPGWPWVAVHPLAKAARKLWLPG